MPEDIHSIHTLGTRSTRHLHVYGLALEKLDKRNGYDPDTGTVQPYNADVHAADRESLMPMRSIDAATLPTGSATAANWQSSTRARRASSAHRTCSGRCRARCRAASSAHGRCCRGFTTRIVCVDDGRGVAGELAAYLEGIGATRRRRCSEGGTRGMGGGGGRRCSPASTCRRRRSASGSSTITGPRASTRRN